MNISFSLYQTPICSWWWTKEIPRGCHVFIWILVNILIGNHNTHSASKLHSQSCFEGDLFSTGFKRFKPLAVVKLKQNKTKTLQNYLVKFNEQSCVCLIHPPGPPPSADFRGLWLETYLWYIRVISMFPSKRNWQCSLVVQENYF